MEQIIPPASDPISRHTSLFHPYHSQVAVAVIAVICFSILCWVHSVNADKRLLDVVSPSDLERLRGWECVWDQVRNDLDKEQVILEKRLLELKSGCTPAFTVLDRQKMAVGLPVTTKALLDN